MNPLFTSDLHLGHKLAAKLRGYDSVYDHDEAIIETLVKLCQKRTVLYVLGDVAMSKESLTQLYRVEGRKILIRGNHDTYPMEDYLNHFEEIHGFLKYKNMWLSHCPIHPQEMFRAEVNVHGHIHKGAATGPIGFPYININWDFWHRPLTLDELKGMKDSKTDGLDD